MKLGLGTAEFTTKAEKHSWQVPLEEIRNIVGMAENAGMRLLDTASDTGNSEGILSDCLTENHSFRLVTQTSSIQPDFMISHQAEQLDHAFRYSLELLGQDSVYGLMISLRSDLLTVQGERLFRRMEILREQGLVEKVGISVASGEEIDWALSRFKPEIVQLSLNVLDQRLLASGHLARLKKQGIEVHVRDIFLQGVLMDPLHLPPLLWPLKKQMEQYHDFLIHEGLTPLEGALNFITSLPEVDYALVGVQSASQLGELIGAITSGIAPDDFAPFSTRDARFLEPAQWNLYK